MDQSLNQPCKKFVLRLESIAEIMENINGEIDQSTAFYVLLDHIATHLDVDAVALYVTKNGEKLENIARLGFRLNDHVKTMGSDEGGQAKKVLSTGKAIRYNQTTGNSTTEKFLNFMRQEGFYDYLGLPLVEDKNIAGVLELFSCTPFNTTQDWQLHLRFILGLSASTIQRKKILHKRKMTETELEVAYSETLEAWVRALEIRDRYTAGHTQRVLELTLRLAIQMGIPQEMLVHTTRGVLLHDIGKLAISDKILHKTGPLDNNEWQEMREHPRFAYNLLKPIHYLRPALDIPYCHHEKWDGSGYPRGLRADEIPFQARIFAVVDVWDALTTDRPYRAAWAKQDALSYIQSKAGTEFDPKVVEEFVDLVQSEQAITQPIPVDGTTTKPL